MILIGFEYQGENKLPGTLIDLYRAKKYGESIGALISSSPDLDQETIIFSDCENKKDFREALIELDSGILNFHQKIIRIFDLDELLEKITIFVKNHDYILVYYSGHCRDSMMILPSEEKLDFKNLEMMMMRINEKLELAFILDCCDFKSELISFCISPKIDPVSTQKGSVFSKEVLGKEKGLDWLDGIRKRVLRRNGFLFVFDLNQVSDLKKYY